MIKLTHADTTKKVIFEIDVAIEATLEKHLAFKGDTISFHSKNYFNTGCHEFFDFINSCLKISWKPQYFGLKLYHNISLLLFLHFAIYKKYATLQSELLYSFSRQLCSVCSGTYSLNSCINNRFWRNFSWQFYLLSEFFDKSLLRGIRRRNIFFFSHFVFFFFFLEMSDLSLTWC